MEWGLGGLPVAAILGLMLIGLDLAGVRPGTLWQDLVRTALFLLVALLIGWLRQRLDRQGRELSRALTARRESEEKRRELAELARRQEEQLEHSTRPAELGEMAAAISHELNQPLTGIRNYARNAFYMLEKKAGGEEEVKGNLRLISEQVDRAAKIINQMRELTRRSDSVSHRWSSTAWCGRASSSCFPR